MGWFIPLVVAAASLFASKRTADVSASRARRAQQDQGLEMERQNAAIASQESEAKKEKERLQKEESDRIRSSKKRGRRALLYGDETGVGEESGLRKTLG